MTPKEIVIADLAREGFTLHQGNTDAGVDWCMAEFYKHPNHKTYIDQLCREAFRERINDLQSRFNSRQRTLSGEYGGPAKVLTTTPEMAAIHNEIYSYSLAGKLIGTIMGCELDAIERSESAKGDGCYVNARLCHLLKKHVPDDKCVRESVSAQKLHRLLNQAKKSIYGKTVPAV